MGRTGEKKGYSPMSQAELAQLPDGMYATMETEKGNIILELFYEKTPATVANFVALAEGKAGQDQKKGRFYDGLSFHRVVDGFVVQGGDPKGNGTGGPGYQFEDEIVSELVFDKAGLLAMANAGPGTNGSQFFITLDPTPHLNGRHTIFGRVVSDGDMSNVRLIRQGDKMKNVAIVRKGASAESFVADRKMHSEKALESKIAATVPNAKKTSTGILYVVEKTGTGNKASKGASIDVHYKGWLLTSGMVFDSSYERGEPISFSAGAGQVIPGWDEMVLDMLIGEKRIVVLPPDQAYGAQGAGGVIPAHAWLVFEMERLK
ncbi:MAG: peptidylprolyl isomerase [Spirochaetia bacterium]